MIPLNGEKMSLYYPWSVNEIVHRGHFVECYKSVFIVHLVSEESKRKWSNRMMKEKDGCMIRGKEMNTMR